MQRQSEELNPNPLTLKSCLLTPTSSPAQDVCVSFSPTASRSLQPVHTDPPDSTFLPWGQVRFLTENGFKASSCDQHTAPAGMLCSQFRRSPLTSSFCFHPHRSPWRCCFCPKDIGPAEPPRAASSPLRLHNRGCSRHRPLF